MPAGLPELRVEIDASTNPTAWTTPSAWTRIDQTNGWRALRITRGQQDTHGPVEPGEMVITLSNANGFLDPSYPASPYTGLLTPGRQIRVVHVKADASTQVIFRGNVEAWPVAFTTSGNDATTTLVVRDFLALLGTSRQPPSVVEYELARGVKYPRPSSLYPMNEESGGSGTVIADTLGDWDATPSGSPQRTSDLVPFTDGAGYTVGAERYVMQIPNGAFQYASPPWSIMCMVRIAAGGEMTMFTDTPPSGMRFAVRDSGGNMVVQAHITDSAGLQSLVGGPAMDDNMARPQLLIDDGSFLRARYGRGTIIASKSHGTLSAASDNWEVGFGKSAALGLLMVWNGVTITADNMAAIHDDTMFPWAGDSTDQRITKLLDIVTPGIVKSYLLSGAVVTCLPAKLASSPTLPLIRSVVESADGRCWVDRTGTLRYAHRQTAAPGAALRTYGTAGTGGVPVRHVAITDAHEDVVTHCLVTNEVGTSVAFHDTAKDRGEHRLEVKESPLQSPSAMWHLAERTVHYRKSPVRYVNEIELAPSHPGVGYDDTLALDLYDRIDAAYVRSWDAGVATSEGEVIGVEHVGQATGGAQFTTRVRLRPVRRQRKRLSVGTATTNEGASTPDSPANSITGDIDIRARFYLNDWNKAFAGLVNRGDFTTLSSSYGIYGRAGALEFVWQEPSGTNQVLVFPKVLNFSSDRPVWVRATLDVSNASSVWEAKAYTSEDGNTWRQVTQAVGTAATSIRDGGNPLEIGMASDSSGAPTKQMNGRMLYAEVRNGIDGPVVARFDPNDAASTAATSWVSSTGETWTRRANSTLEAW